MADFHFHHYMPEARQEREVYRANARSSLLFALPVGVLAIMGSSLVLPWLPYQGSLLVGVIACLLSIQQGLVGLVSTCDIAVGEHELRLYVLDPWSINLGFWGTVVRPWFIAIPLESFREARFLTCRGHYQQISLWLRRKKTKDENLVDAISVPGLGVIGYLTGLWYGLRLRPVFIVSPNHERQYELLHMLYQLAGKGTTHAHHRSR